MFKNMTISGKTNLITEILAAVVWLIAVAPAQGTGTAFAYISIAVSA